jgi:cytochrome P450
MGSLSIVHQTVSTIMSFFVAMLLYPNIQKKGRDELDSAVGRQRLPSFGDRPRLPFIDAVCKELLRWRPATPLGVSLVTRTKF